MKNKPRETAVQPPPEETNETLSAINEPENPPELTKALAELNELYKTDRQLYADVVAMIDFGLKSEDEDSVPTAERAATMTEQANPSEETEFNPEETITIKKSTLLEIEKTWFALESFLSIVRQDTKPYSEIGADGAYHCCGQVLELIGKKFSDEFNDLYKIHGIGLKR